MALRLLKSIPVGEAQFEGSTLVCWPSVTGVMDLYQDVIFPGAFKKCLPLFLDRGFCPTDHEWKWGSIVAIPTVAEERGNKLYSECVFHSDQNSQDALTKCRERLDLGKQVGQSIGFMMMQSGYVSFDNGKALLAYAKKKGYDMALFDVKGIGACTDACSAIIDIEELWEYSLTPVPANQHAMAIAIKSAPGVSLSVRDAQPQSHGPLRVTQKRDKPMRLKTICGAHGLPLTSDGAAWNAKDAEQRLRAFAKATDGPNADYAKGFVMVEGPNDEFGSYKLQFVDVVDGELVAIPKALMSAANVLGGISAPGFDMSDEAQSSARTFVDGYYAKMGDVSTPWSGSADAKFKGQYLGNYVERDMCMSAVNSAHWDLYYEIGDAIGGYGEYNGLSIDAVCSAVEGMYNECSGLSRKVIRAILTDAGTETPEQAVLSIRRSIQMQLSSLGDGLSYTRQAQVAVDATAGLVERTRERLAMRQKAGRELSEANRQTLKDHVAALEDATAAIKQLLADTEPKAVADSEELKALRLDFLRLEIAPA